MSSALKKANYITQIVRFKQIVRRWKSKSLRSGSSALYYYSSSSDSDSDSDEPAAPRRTPSGSVAVYVGSERRRFVIPTRFLNLPVFVALLDQAEEEFGYPVSGALALPCEARLFTEILRLLDENEEKFCSLGLDDFLKIMVSKVGFELYN